EAGEVSLYISNVLHTGGRKFFEGTELLDVSIRKGGGDVEPEVVVRVVMNARKRLSIVGTEIAQRTWTLHVDGTTGLTVSINGQAQPSEVLTFNIGTVLSNIVVSKSGWIISPAVVESLTMNDNQVLEFTAINANLTAPDLTLALDKGVNVDASWTAV